MEAKQAYHHGNLREALLETAASIINEDGVRVVTMRSLSERLGVSRSAAYRHFEGKDDLLACVARDGFRRLCEALRKARHEKDHERSITERFHEMGRAYLQFAVNHSAHYRLMFGQRSWNDTTPESLEAAGAQAYDELVQIIRNGQKSDVFRSGSTDDLALAVWSHVHGMASLIIDGHAEDLLGDDQRLSFVLRTIKGGVGND
jgi:AcrR family transcriptional regulator